MPTNAEEKSNQLWSLLKEKLESAKKASTEFLRKPTTWLQSLQQDFIKTYFSNPDIENLIIQTTSIATTPEDILNFLEENPQLAIATVASGFKGELLILHHIKGFTLEEGEEKKYFALNGSEFTSNLLQTIPQRLFKNEVSSVPNLEFFVENKENDILNTPIEDNTVNETIANSIILPPNVTKALIEAKAYTTEAALKVVLDLTKDMDEQEKEKWSNENEANKNETESIDENSITSEELREGTTSTEWQHNAYKNYLTLNQHMFKWAKSNKREAGYRLSTHETPTSWQTKMNNDLSSNKPNEENNNEQPTNQTGLDPNKRYEAPDHLNFPNNNNMITPPRNQNNTGTRFTFGNEDKTKSNDTTPNLSSPTLEVAINKMAGAMEKFANTQAAQTKEKQKIPNNILQMLLNAGTTDGQEPSEDITENLRDIMRSGQENTQLSLDLMLHKNKASATPTARFVRGIHKGLWAYEPGVPDNVTIMNLPGNLSGTTLENVDITKLKEEEARGRELTEKERGALYGKVTVPAKTMNYLLEKQKAWEAIILECFHPNSVIAEEAVNWREWMEENMNLLKSKTYSADRDLPCRIECMIADLNNQYLTAAKFGVPAETILVADDIRQGITRNTVKPDIPKSILEILHPEKKRSLEKGGEKTQNRDQSQKFQLSRFDKQPREFKMSTEKYRAMIHMQVTEKKVKAPRYEDGNCSECCRFLFLGSCNTNCPRAKAHKCPTTDSTRMNNIRKFIKDCSQTYKNNKKPNDPNFE
jgi:hypothetical protein